MNVPYLPGDKPVPDLPLGRFLPPIPAGMVPAWCESELQHGDWVLDPFGFNPYTAIEIASSGHPILVCVNNPVSAFLLKVLASAPQNDEMTAALQDLAVANKGDVRMESYIRGLYRLDCLNCHHQTEASAFLWRKEEDQPFAALVDCPHCGASGEQNITAETLASLAPLPPKRLHLARALNRIIDQDRGLQSQVEQALNAYPTRQLIILQTIINKLESLEQSPRRRELLIALILSAADQGNTLWAYPSPRSRPRQITIPGVYQEKNLWHVLENSATNWQVIKAPVPVFDWSQNKPQEPGIYIFQGRIRELIPVPEKNLFSAVITAIPRPNQAFWTLSALWTGWIWGHEAVTPIRMVLLRQRYDWNWHCNALIGLLTTIHKSYDHSLKIWGLVTENEPMFLLSVMLAADSSGYRLMGFSRSADDQLAQCYWEPVSLPQARKMPKEGTRIACEKVAGYLRQKGEPASYQWVHTAAIAGLAHENIMATDIFLQNTSQAASETQKWIETIFKEFSLLKQVNDEKTSLASADWWLVDPSGSDQPLIDRVEQIVFEYLLRHQTSPSLALKTELYQKLPGLFTPLDSDLLICLESYADLDLEGEPSWKLRQSEHPLMRETDIESILNDLESIGDVLGYRIMGRNPLIWMDESKNQVEYRFNVISSAIVSTFLHDETPSTGSRIIVLPGSRANLLAYKKQRDPNLMHKLQEKVIVVKFRLVRDLKANPLLTRSLFKEQIQVDPPEYRSSQLALF